MVDVFGVLKHVEGRDHGRVVVVEGQVVPEIGDDLRARIDVDADVARVGARERGLDLPRSRTHVDDRAVPDPREGPDDGLGFVDSLGALHDRECEGSVRVVHAAPTSAMVIRAAATTQACGPSLHLVAGVRRVGD